MVIGLAAAGIALASGVAGYVLGDETGDGAGKSWEASERGGLPDSGGDGDEGFDTDVPDAEDLPGLSDGLSEPGDELSQLLESGGDALQQYLQEQGVEQLRELLGGQSS